jgi:hypothetical protein
MRELQFSFNDCIATMYNRANVNGAALNKIEDNSQTPPIVSRVLFEHTWESGRILYRQHREGSSGSFSP